MFWAHLIYTLLTVEAQDQEDNQEQRLTQVIGQGRHMAKLQQKWVGRVTLLLLEKTGESHDKIKAGIRGQKGVTVGSKIFPLNQRT